MLLVFPLSLPTLQISSGAEARAPLQAYPGDLSLARNVTSTMQRACVLGCLDFQADNILATSQSLLRTTTLAREGVEGDEPLENVGAACLPPAPVPTKRALTRQPNLEPWPAASSTVTIC